MPPRRLTLWLILAICGCAALAHARSFVLARTLQKPRPAHGDSFGSSVAAVGPNVLVGAPGDSAVAPSAGAAYLFDGSTGALLHRFASPVPTDGGQFGWSVAAVGPNVLVGARRDDAVEPIAGAAYLFDGMTGALLHSLVSPDSALEGDFGFSVAAVGSNALVGAPNDHARTGAAYLFDGRTGQVLHTFQKSSPVPDDFFGCRVASVGSTVLVGAPGDDTAAPNAGAIYLFDAVTGAFLKTFYSPSRTTNRGFGDTLAVVGSNVLAPTLDAAYLLDGETGAVIATFPRPTSSPWDGFGSSAAAVGGDVLIGAASDSTVVQDGGAAYLFDGASGALLDTFRKPTPVFRDVFGSSSAALGPNVVVGAPNDDAGQPNAGAVYLFADRSCGDGVLDRGEGCDDGNTADGDGCSGSCRVGDFACHEIRTTRGTPKFRRREVVLTEGSATTRAAVVRPEALWTPVRDETPGVRDATAYLTCYEIEATGRRSRSHVREVSVRDRFGRLTLTVRTPRALCVPSARVATPSSVPLDHLVCGRVESKSGMQGRPRRDIVLTEGSASRKTRVLRPWTFCSPVDKNGEGVPEPADSLTCYRIKVRERGRGQSSGATVRDQFGDLSLAVGRPRLLCVPSREQ